MVIVQINQTYKIGSTGKIMYDLNQVIQSSGHESFMVAGYSNDHSPQNLYCANKNSAFFPIRKDQVIFRLSGVNGYRYKKRTQKIIEWIDSKHPDIIHLHNIHGDWIHLQTLFDYIKRKEIRVVWTLHDCWALTGRCSHFELCGCDKWKTNCFDCNNNRVYPITYFFDRSSKMHRDKKKWFTGIKNMTVVTPSIWLASFVKQSFLREYPIKVIPSGINTEIFKPQKKQSKYYVDIKAKYIILGVANTWSKSKGIDDFIALDKVIDHDKYQIVMVGLNSRQLKSLPHTIYGLSKTNSQLELAELYSGASCYLNCSILETQGLTTIEAMACGTPVIVYNKSAVPESVKNDCGIIIDTQSIDIVYDAIKKICNNTENYKAKCCEYAKNNYDGKRRFMDYIGIYCELMSNG